MELVDDAILIALLRVVFAWIDVLHSEAQRVVEQHGQIPRGRRHRLGFASSCSQPAIEGADRSVRFADMTAAMRSTAAARFADLRVRELRTRLPEILFPGASE